MTRALHLAVFVSLLHRLTCRPNHNTLAKGAVARRKSPPRMITGRGPWFQQKSILRGREQTRPPLASEFTRTTRSRNKNLTNSSRDRWNVAGIHQRATDCHSGACMWKTCQCTERERADELKRKLTFVRLRDARKLHPVQSNAFLSSGKSPVCTSWQYCFTAVVIVARRSA